MDMPFTIYRKKALGCWLGKAVGGTLGGPWEGRGGPHDLTFYDPVPREMLPNDDLDLQVVWLEAIRRRGLPVDRLSLARAWLDSIHFWPDEYGVACRNLAQGIFPPASGAFDNGFTAGMGAAIRSELWACLAPGDPALAARLAVEDACVDHAEEGLYAEVYLASLESAAFVENDREKLLDLARSTIPADTRVARAIAHTREWWAASGDWREVRRRILEVHGRRNFTDVAQNLAITILGWLAGEGRFGPSICTAVNCGKDADCTGATLGALLGILDPDSIGQEWLKPIGRDLVLSPGIAAMHPARTLDEFTDQVAALAVDVLAYYGSHVRLTNAPEFTDIRANMAPPRIPAPALPPLPVPPPEREALLALIPLVVTLTYPPGTALLPDRPNPLQLTIKNPTDREHDVTVSPRVPDGWTIRNASRKVRLAAGTEEAILLHITPPHAAAPRPYLNPLDVSLRVENLSWMVTAGLPLTLPWRRWFSGDLDDTCPVVPRDAAAVEAAGHEVPLPAQAAVFLTEVKLASHVVARWIVQAPRKVVVWLDGEKINQHDGTHRVPAVHRAGPTGADVQKRAGWHRVTIAVGPGKEAERLFFGLGDPLGWDWLRDAEFRLPQV